jgi:septal ring factor EnvC (AmiA/AmiB activator)
MKSLRYIAYFSLLIALALGSTLSAQNKTTLQNKKKKLQKDINYTNTLIKKNKKKQDASMKQIETLNSSISTRVELVDNYTEELNEIAKEINLNESQINTLEGQLKTLKKSYSKMVYNAWKTRNSMNTWMYIFSAKNFNQAVRRYRYYKQINELRIIQTKSITQSKTELADKTGLLKKSKNEKEITIQEKSNEVASLEKQKKEKDLVLKSLKKKEKDLLAQAKKQEKERDALAIKINSIIETTAPKKDKNKTKTTTNSNTKTNSSNNNKTTANTKTEVPNTQGSSNSNGFELNKGKLSWPVSKGIITGKFGVHQHPVLDKVEVKNDGIDISTDKGSSVRAVYKGTVSGVFKVDGFENVVIIRHGDYLTVYSHLSQVSVSKGADVTTDQKIGTAATNSEGDTYINFQVRFGSAIQNPTTWLTK